MQPSQKDSVFEKGDVAGIPILVQVGGQDNHLDASRVRQFYESLKSNYRQRPDRLKFIQEENIGHEFTASMWRNVIKWFNKHL